MAKKEPKQEEEKKEESAEGAEKSEKSAERKAHDADAKKPIELRVMNHTVCGICKPEEAARGEESAAKGEVVEELEGETDCSMVVTHKDTSKPLPTHKRVRLTEKSLEANPELAKRGLHAGDVIQVPLPKK